MFPSTNINNRFEFLANQSPSLCDHLTSKQDLDPSFFLTFPSPFFDELELPLNHILSQNQIMAENHQHVENHIQKDSSDISTKTGKSAKRGIVTCKTVDNQAASTAIVKRRNLGAVPRKRTGKKDRHSKICTAQGIRDRRMRLSLQVARKFFDLQDMLGYDKASKTIEWLFTKSKKAIKELIKEHDPTQANNDNYNCTSEAKSESFLSECEVVSGSIEETSNNIEVKEGILPTNLMQLCISPCETTDHEIKPRKMSACTHNSMRRDKARARARCRTIEKMMIKELDLTTQLYKSLNPNLDVHHKLGSSSKSPFEGVDQESGSMNQERVFTCGADFTSSLEQQSDDVGTIEKLLKWSSSSRSSRFCPISEYNNNQSYVAVSSCIDSNFMGLIGNLDLVNNHSMNSSQYSVTHQVSLAGSSSNSPFEGVDQESNSCKQERVSQFGADVGTIEKLLEINSSSSIPNYGGNNKFMGFLGNWDMLNNIDRLNSTSVTNNQVSLAGNSTSIYSAAMNPN